MRRSIASRESSEDSCVGDTRRSIKEVKKKRVKAGYIDDGSNHIDQYIETIWKKETYFVGQWTDTELRNVMRSI